MNDKPVIEKMGVATIVSIIPTKVWIESGMFGDRYVMRQHEGYPAFEYARFGYDYSHTSNSQTMNDATRLALALGATEPVEHKNREFISFAKSPVEIENDTLRARIAELEAAFAKLKTPEAVHIAMVRGDIAKISMKDCAHLHGGEVVAQWQAAAQAVPVQAIPEGCACKWDGGELVSSCELHQAWRDAIHEWATRAKEAEAKLALLSAAPTPSRQSPQAEPPQPTDGGVKEGSWNHLRLMMESSAWDGKLELSDALANINDFSATQPTQDADSREAATNFTGKHLELLATLLHFVPPVEKSITEDLTTLCCEIRATIQAKGGA